MTDSDSTLGTRLPCGCLLGLHQCGESLRLWSEAHRVYEAWRKNKATWDEYQAAMKAYRQHYAVAVVK